MSIHDELPDYLIALTIVHTLDDEGESCPIDEIGCDGQVAAQFYYIVDGVRHMQATCKKCLLGAVIELTESGDKIVVEMTGVDA